jgi:nucleolar protein TMA23
VFAGDKSFEMPLDGHAFLLGQGWSGTGSGLRKGAISRPITAPQKRNLAGIGKDKCDDFPFWDQ